MICFVLQACPFVIDVYTEDCDDAEFKVEAIEDMMDKLQRPLCQSVMEKVKEKLSTHFIFSFNMCNGQDIWFLSNSQFVIILFMHFFLPSFYDKKDSDIQFFVDMNDHCLLFIEKITTKHKEQPKYNIKS